MAEVTPDVAWTQPDWLGEAYTWIDRRLEPLGLERTAIPEQIHEYPWATVLRVPTSGPQVFFKAMVPLLAHEAGAIAVLARLRPELVTEILDADRELGWMLMADAGVEIRSAPTERIEDWERLLVAYAELQREAVSAVDDLVAAGVPERLTDEVTGQLAEVLEDDEAVWAGREHGLTDDERRRLRNQGLPRVAEVCQELAALPIPDTIQHDDLHGGQVFARDGRWRILDWGDACISHPLASLLVPLRSLVYREVIAEDAPELERLRDAYLEPWTGVAPREDLLRAVDLARVVGRATRLLSWQRIVPHFDPPAHEEYGDSVPRWFRALLGELD